MKNKESKEEKHSTWRQKGAAHIDIIDHPSYIYIYIYSRLSTFINVGLLNNKKKATSLLS